jgi:hypothetical protein
MNGINALALAKGNERFCLIFTDANKPEALRTLGRWASDPELPAFNWYDAATLSNRIRLMEAECCGR